MSKGRLLVIEGLDGSGKATQAKLLAAHLAESGCKVMEITFPDYESDSSALVKMYLSGQFGDKPDDVNPYAASSFYAVDRYASYKTKWGSFYEAGGIVIADRYTTSNAVHQCSKLPPEQWDDFLRWAFDYEYRLLGLPAPDAVAARCADPAIADDLKYVLATANAMAAGRYQVAYCPSLVRGQGYYTGMVFEITCPQFSGAVAGGGRYDNMVGKFLGTQVPAVGFSIGFERVCGILLEQGYQIPGAKQKIALLYGKDADFTAVLSKAAALRDTYNVTVLPQGKKLGKQLGQLEAAGFAGAAFMDKDEVKVFAAQ